MTIIELNKRFYTVPQSWNELTGKQLVAVCDVLLQKPEEVTGKMKLLKILTGMSSWRWLQQSVAELEDHLYLVDFLITEMELTEQVLPHYAHRNKWYRTKQVLYGPQSNFDNLLIGEFSFCEYYYNQYENKGIENGINELNQLVGTLYRKQKAHYNAKTNPDGDCRMPFNKNLCDAYYPSLVEEWPLAVKVAIGWWFKSCRIELQKQFGNVFSGGGDVAKYGMWSVMNTVAEKGNHGNFTQVENMLLKEFMMELSESIEKNKKLEQKLNANKPG